VKSETAGEFCRRRTARQDEKEKFGNRTTLQQGEARSHHHRSGGIKNGAEAPFLFEHAE
jgi:hypothetical protein